MHFEECRKLTYYFAMRREKVLKNLKSSHFFVLIVAIVIFFIYLCIVKKNKRYEKKIY